VFRSSVGSRQPGEELGLDAAVKRNSASQILRCPQGVAHLIHFFGGRKADPGAGDVCRRV
jgi:hypothetical protein